MNVIVNFSARMFIYIYIYIYIYKQANANFKCVTSNTWIKKTHIIYLKPQIFFFFSEALSMRDRIAKENTE